jgi:hypothetical protein
MIEALNVSEIGTVTGGTDTGGLTVLVQVAHTNANGDTYYVGTWMSPANAALYRAAHGSYA